MPLRCKLSTFSSNAYFHYYDLPITFNVAVFNQPLCIDLQLRYFGLSPKTQLRLRSDKAFCGTSGLHA